MTIKTWIKACLMAAFFVLAFYTCYLELYAVGGR